MAGTVILAFAVHCLRRSDDYLSDGQVFFANDFKQQSSADHVRMEILRIIRTAAGIFGLVKNNIRAIKGRLHRSPVANISLYQPDIVAKVRSSSASVRSQ